MLPDGFPEYFWAEVGASARCVLMLDYDGTLAPFQVDRDRAYPYRGVEEALERILRDTDTRLVLVSGRWTKDLTRLLRLDLRPEMFGSHGLERLHPDGRHEILPLEERTVAGLAEIDAMAIRDGLEERIERKPGCVALHWRGFGPEEIRNLRRIVEDRWSEVVASSGLRVAEFNGGMEIRAPNRDKGDVVRTILAEEPEGTAVAYLGDDRTDEDAFGAIEGKGLGILVAAENRPTKASVRLTPPEGVLDFLRQWRKERGKD